MEISAKIGKGYQLLTIFAKRTISENSSEKIPYIHAKKKSLKKLKINYTTLFDS